MTFISDNMNLWVLGNFSRFIRPGYQRVDHATDQSESLNKLMGSAYLSPDGKRLVIVYVNMGSATGVKINVNGQSIAKDIHLYRTSATENLKNIVGTYALGNRIMIPAKSVNTIVIDFENGITNGIADVKQKSTKNDSRIYNINGQLVKANEQDTKVLAKGVYIQNGKKFIVK